MLRKHSKDRTADNTKKTRFHGYVYDFSVDYNAIAVDDILDIHNCLMKKNDSIIKCLGLIKMLFWGELTILSSVNPLSTTQLSATPLNCISMTNRECKVRPEIFNFNSDEPVF